jgi:hypothetical protein
MRIRTGLGILICCCAALAACTAGPPKGPNATVSTPSVGRPPAPASAQAALSSEAFTPYAGLSMSSNDGLAPGESTFALAGACMTAAGYPRADTINVWPSIAGPAGGLAITMPWGAWGYLGAADAQQYGFQFPLGSVRSVLGLDAQPTSQASPSPAEQAAVGKCATLVQDFANAVDDGPLADIGTLGTDISTDVVQAPAVKAAARTWSACMAKNGYSADQPSVFGQQRLVPIHATPLSASAQRAQLAAAVADAGCTLSSDLAGIYFAVQASYEQQLVTANQQALTAAVKQYKGAYAKDLSKLAALLHTAKAQPFPPVKTPARRRSPAS